ncbi:hypothetical protein BGZ54_000006 [Gamsiella multidivaricata]|nr:hypothetical protein BGZ54_000006 [Gamsiella multidivaricata]
MKLLNYCNYCTSSNWVHISSSLGFSVAECKARLKTAQIQDERLKNWSMTLEISTEHEKSVPELVHLMGQGKTWPEIAETMQTEEELCRAQWAKLGAIYSMEHPKMLRDTRLLRVLKNSKFNLSRCDGRGGTEGPTTGGCRSLTGVDLYDWDRLSREASNSEFSPEHLRYRFITLARNRIRWTAEDRQALYGFIERSLSAHVGMGLVDGEPDWYRASREIVQGRHSPYDCRAQWRVYHRELRPGRHYLPWTASEVLEFWEAWQEYGDNWTAIANNISSGHQPRTPKNCQGAFHFVISKAKELQASRRVLSNTSSQVFVKSGVRSQHSWTPELIFELQRIVQEETNFDKQRQTDAGHYDPTCSPKIRWTAVARRLDVGISPKQCKYCWLKATFDSHGSDTTSRRGTPIYEHDRKRLMELLKQGRPHGAEKWIQFQQTHFPTHSLDVLKREYTHYSLKELIESKALMRQLEELVLKYGEHSWRHVAKAMSASGLPRTSRHCQQAWAAQQVQTNAQWSLEELDNMINAVDDIQQKRLSESVLEHTNTDDNSSLPKLTTEDWITIGRLFPSKTSVQCRSKWSEIKVKKDGAADVWDNDSNFNSLRKGSGAEAASSSHRDLPQSVWNKIRWTPERSAVLTTAVEKFGGSDVVFEQVARRLGTTKSACQARWFQEKSLKKDASKRFLWNEKYDRILLETVAEHKKMNLTIKVALNNVAKQLDGCPQDSPRGRWRYLGKLRKKQAPQDS